MILRGLQIISKQLLYLAVVIAMLLTLLIASVYWLSNAVEQRQDEMASWVSEQVGYPITIGTARLDWVGLEPKLQIGDIAILSEENQQQIVTVGELHVGLDLIASIQSGQATFNDITLNNLKLAVIRDHTGQIQLRDFNLPSAHFDWLTWVKLLSRFHFKNIHIDYTDQFNAALSGQYEMLSGTITHQDERWTITGDVELPASLGDNIIFSAQAELNSDASQIGVWQGDGKLINLQLGALADDFVWQDIMVSKGVITAQLSATGVGSHIDSVTTELNLSQVELVSSGNDYPTVTLDMIQGRTEWKKAEDAWRLSGELAVSANGDDWPETAFTIDQNAQGDWHVVSQYLRLSDLTSLALLSNNTPEIIRQLQAAGDIEALNLRYSADKGLTELAFKLREGVFLPWQDYPGVTNLTTQVNWQNGFGIIRLDSRDLTLYAKPWLDDALFFNAITGVLRLEYEQQQWQLYSEGLHVWNDDLSVQVEGEINKKVDGSIINDLKVTLNDITVNQWEKYIPTKGFDPDFKTWADDAFVAGKIATGEIILKGDLAAFPYEKEPDKGQFKMVLQAEDVQLHYAPGWPDLTGLTGTITGSGNDLIIKTKQGKTAGFDFIDVTAIITKLTESKPILRVKGDVTGTTAKALQFLNDSPLKQRFGIVADSVTAKGKSNINLNLMVPLADVDNIMVSGYVSFKDSQLSYKASPEISMTQINGKLYFSETGMQAKNINATAFNEAVTINVKPDGYKAIISIASHISTKEVNTIWPKKLPLYITGRTAYKVDLTVIEKDLGEFYLDVALSSDLKGITLAIPAPMDKTATQVIPLKASMQNSNNALVYAISYGDVFNAVIKPKMPLWQGEIRFGKGEAVLPKNGIKVAGQLESISIDDWLKWADKQSGDKMPLVNSIDHISLTVAKLMGFDQTITNLNLTSQKDAQGWRINIDSNQARGYIYLPDDLTGSATIKVDLERLAITLPKKDGEVKPTQQAPAMSLWPSIDISIGSLLLDDKLLGKLALNATRTEHQWKINSAQLASDVFTLSVLTGMWTQSAVDKTDLQLQLASNDLALLLANFGYQQAIDAEQIIMKAELSWPNTPADFELAIFTGTLNMTIGKGTLQDVAPGAAGRVLGLMSITALPRRLSLDFSDLFGKGFTFDSITGDFKFKNGQAITDNFMLKSASAEIKITGDVDLANQRYDQYVIITPNVSATLPLAGAVAGGPVGLGVGTAILLIDKITATLFDKNIINVISAKYALTGSWDDPQLNAVTSVEPTRKIQ